MNNELELRVSQALVENQHLIDLLVKKNEVLQEMSSIAKALNYKGFGRNKKKATVKTATTAKTFEPTKKENKSKKLLLLLKPTLHERLKTKAASFDMSINELVNQILEQNV